MLFHKGEPSLPHRDACCEQLQQQPHVRDSKRALQRLGNAGFFAKGFLCTRFTCSQNARNGFALVTTSSYHLYKDTIFPFQCKDGTLVLPAYGRLASHYKDQVFTRENYIPGSKFGLSDLQCWWSCRKIKWHIRICICTYACIHIRICIDMYI